MRTTLLILTLALLLNLLSGCGGQGALGGSSGDPNVGGGRLASADADSGGGRLPPADSPASESARQLFPLSMQGTPGIELAPLAPGDSAQRGAVTFQLDQVQIGAALTVVAFTVSGLPTGYQPAEGSGEPSILLADGQVFQASGGRGNGAIDTSCTQVTETARYTFPTLPAGTQEFVLVIPNNWTGTAETWRIPVKVRL